LVDPTGPRGNELFLELSVRQETSHPQFVAAAGQYRSANRVLELSRYNLRPLTPAQLAALNRPLATPVGGEQPEFVSMTHDRWMYEAIWALSRAGIIEGFDQERYRGGKGLVRYEFAVAMYRLLQGMRDEKRFIEGGTVVIPLNESGAFQVPATPTVQGYFDIIAALEREFQPEISRLGVRTSLDDGGSAMRNPGWSRYISNGGAAGHSEYVWMSLSYGRNADARLIERLKQTVAAYAAEQEKK
jgi:hypothetical protein